MKLKNIEIESGYTFDLANKQNIIYIMRGSKCIMSITIDDLESKDLIEATEKEKEK